MKEDAEYYKTEIEMRVKKTVRKIRFCPFCGGKVTIRARCWGADGSMYVCMNKDCGGHNQDLEKDNVVIFAVSVYGGDVYDCTFNKDD